jgi:hypothetical protein
MRGAPNLFALLSTLALACGPTNGGEATEAGTGTDATGTDATGTDATGTDATGADATSTGPTSTDPTGEPTTTSTGDPTGDETGAPMPVDCNSVPVDHAAACPEPCAIDIDLEIRCADGEFAAPGLRVAGGSDSAWLVTASSTDAMLFSLAADGATRNDVLPIGWIRETILLALGAAGDLHLMAQVMVYDPEFGSAMLHVAEAADWAASTVFETSKGLPPLDLEVDLAGAPHLWFVGDAPDGNFEAVADGDQWTVGDVVAPAMTEWQHFGLTTEGATVATGFLSKGNGGMWQLQTRIDGVEAKLGSAVFASYPYPYRLATAPRPTVPAASPSVAAAIQHTGSLRVAWPLPPATYAELQVPDTAVLEPSCFGQWDRGCPGPCQETATGVEDAAFAFARAPDGRGWLAYVTTQLDVQFSYEEDCEDREDIGCYCRSNIDSESTSGVLHLLRVDLELATATEVLTLPVRAPALSDMFSGWSDTPRAVDLYAHGTTLTLGLRTQDSTFGERAVRALRIDTTLLP